MSFQEEHVADFKILFDERKLKIRAMQGCKHLELWQDKQHKNVFYTYSIWNGENDLEDYRMSELFKDTWSKVKVWFSDKPVAFSSEQLIMLP